MPSWLTRQAIILIAMTVLVALVIFAGPAACRKINSMAAQSRLDREQGQAAHNSAADAVNTVAASGEAAAASEELSRTNAKEIHDAEGASARVGAGVDVAGRRALCLRRAYRDDPKCRMFQPHP